jgi:hypothetical protein
MKIQVLKSGNARPSFQSCPFFVDVPPPDGGPNRAKGNAK